MDKGIIRLLAYLTLLVTTPAQSITTQEVFPMHTGVQWEYQYSRGSYITSVLDQKHSVNGIQTTAISHSNGNLQYYTNDDKGLRLHKLASPGNLGTNTIVFNSPIQLIERNVIVGGSFVSYGIATVRYPDRRIAYVSYSAKADVIRQENIAVRAGNYDYTYHISYRITLSTSDDSDTIVVNLWLAPGVGPVKHDATDSDEPEFAELISATIPQLVTPKVLWRHAGTGEARFYSLNGPVITSDSSLNTSSSLDLSVAGTGDFNGDGEKDILWRNRVTGENRMDLMNGSTVLYNAYVNRVADRDWEVVGIGDFDGNGKDDILWHHRTNGRVWMYLMDGANIARSKHIAFTALDWEIKETGDYDGDGRADIVWRNKTHGRVWMYLMVGSYIGTDQHVAYSGADWNIMGGGDFNGDGKDDLLWRNSTSGTNWMYLMNGTQIIVNEQLNVLPDLNWKVAVTQDFNGDYKDDILWRHAITGHNLLYRINGTNIIETNTVNQVADLNWKIIE